MRRVDIKKTTAAAMLTAVSVLVCVLASSFSNMGLSFTAITGVFSVMALVILGNKYAWLIYIATCIFCWIFLPNKECAVFYTVLFGHYPMMRLCTERIGKRCLIWAVKLFEYIIMFIISAFIFSFLFGVRIDFNSSETYLFLFFFFVMFALYDICIGHVFLTFSTKLTKNIRFH